METNQICRNSYFNSADSRAHTGVFCEQAINGLLGRLCHSGNRRSLFLFAVNENVCIVNEIR